MTSHLSRVLLRFWLASAFIAAPVRAAAQSPMWKETWVGSEWEMYVRALGARGRLPDDAWSVRPLSPAAIERLATAMPAEHPWSRRLSKRTALSRRWEALRPAAGTSFNGTFPWGFHDGPAWQGRGVNAWATAGAALRFSRLSARLEPFVEYATNRSFELAPVPGEATNRFVDGAHPTTIDLPQRFGDRALRLFSLGQSHLRYDAGRFSAVLSTENVFWGPAFRNSIVLGAEAPGFPHLRIGTGTPMRTRLGRWHGQLLYGQLGESALAPESQGNVRLGAGFVGVWMPPTAPVEIGVARFFHVRWPRRFGARDLLVPFNLLAQHDSAQQAGEAQRDATTNELASIFFRAGAPRAGLELFGEFVRNDRPEDFRDLGIELEHSSAWAIGVLSTWPADPNPSFWTLRMEYLNGRIAAIQQIGRGQQRFYQHSPWTQGHTVRGQLLGSALMERSSGAEVSLDRWAAFGRLGLTLFERQMPEDNLVGMRAAAARSQWDVGANALLFIGSADVSVAAGRVLDINRFPGRDVRNAYFRLGWRMAIR